MKREIAAIIFSTLLAGTAFAGPIESSELPPPSQNETTDASRLRGLIEDALNERDQTPTQTNAQTTIPQQPEYDTWIPSAELLLEGLPEPERLSLDALAMKANPNRIYGSAEKDNSIPTTYTWNRGNWKANVGANITTATNASVIPTEVYAGAVPNSGGTGSLESRVEYDLNTWQFYGGTKRGLVANANGTLGIENNFTGGTYYNLPPSLLGGKVGTGFEVNPTGDAKTRLEYRKVFGVTEGFLAAERSTPFQHTTPDANPVNGLKAGINRKF